MKDLVEKFWSKVLKKELTECWEWQGHKQYQKYGIFTIRSPDGVRGTRLIKFAHRASWEFTSGPIPNGMCVCHKCDNPPCVNPNHLFLGTQKDNIQDMIRKNRSNYLKGSKMITSVLDETLVLELRERYSRGDITCRELGLLYGVDEQTIYGAVSGTYWKQVGGPITKSKRTFLSLADARKLRAMYLRGDTKKELREDFKISITTLNRILASTTLKEPSDDGEKEV